MLEAETLGEKNSQGDVMGTWPQKPSCSPEMR